MSRRPRRLLAALVLSLSAGLLHAAELVIALSTPVTSLDPHFHNLTPNNGLSKHVFENLVHTDETRT